MLKKQNKLFQLLWLCSRLVLNLLVFSLKFALIKLNWQKIISIGLIVAILGSWILNYQLWQSKKPGQLKIEQALSYNPGEIRFELKQAEKERLLELYQQAQQQQVQSRDLLFNWGKLLELENKTAALEKFAAAHYLDPNF